MTAEERKRNLLLDDREVYSEGTLPRQISALLQLARSRGVETGAAAEEVTRAGREGGRQRQLRRGARPDSSADPQKAANRQKERRGDEPPPPPNLRLPHFCRRCIYQSIKTGQKAMKNKKKQPLLMHKRVCFHLRNC